MMKTKFDESVCCTWILKGDTGCGEAAGTATTMAKLAASSRVRYFSEFIMQANARPQAPATELLKCNQAVFSNRFPSFRSERVVQRADVPEAGSVLTSAEADGS